MRDDIDYSSDGVCQPFLKIAGSVNLAPSCKKLLLTEKAGGVK